jgi:UDP-N-acetylmuramoylalanine--D-glutamate ligase
MDTNTMSSQKEHSCVLTLVGRKAVVVGAGDSGRAAAELLRFLGAEVRLTESNASRVDAELKLFARDKGIELVVGEHAPSQFVEADLVVPSPGVPVSKIRPLLNPEVDTEIIGELELAWRCVTEPVLAVTGTSGKTTTVTAAARMLEQAGKKVFLGGNIGTPLSRYVLDRVQTGRADVLVLEASSFQLQTCTTFKPKVAVILNITPNHLDYHEDMEEYREAKLNLLAFQDADDLALLPVELAFSLRGRNVTRAQKQYIESWPRFSESPLLGSHNHANLEAAYQACRFFGVTEEQAREAMKEFTGLPHRLEPVGEARGVLFVNDSKATTVSALCAALLSFTQPVRLLAGGKYKGGDLAKLLPVIQEQVVSVGLFGGSREVFETAWEGAAPLFWEPTLEQAVKRLFAEAQPGDVILLSPATSSFDQYENYKVRGDDFRRIAGALA